jgi:preprotein translocase subunit SecF
MYNIIQKRKIWIGVSASLVALSLVFIIIWGLKLGIDFTGGSLLELRFQGERPSVAEVNSNLEGMELGSLIVQPVGEDGMILRFQNTESEKKVEIIEKLKTIKQGADSDTASSSEPLAKADIEELRYDSVGPSIGNELKRKSISAIVVVIFAIILYIAWSFRKVSKPVASWKYGVAASVALFHDVIITIGVFALLGHFFNIEVSVAFVAALLTILGYSVNDTIVVFDRLRENLPKSNLDFEETVNFSVNQTIGRSINTSLIVLFALFAILLFGGASIRDFALALFIGIFFGTYSSIFLASPLLVFWEKWKK